MDRYLSGVLIAAPLLCSQIQPLQAQDQIGIAVGAVPEAVEIEDLEGDPVDLSLYVGKGKPVLLEFWATWCSLCAELESQMAAAAKKYGDDVRILVIAVAVNQSVRRVKRHVESHEMPGPVLWDGEGRAVRAYMAPSTSYIVILDAEGVVAYTGMGVRQNIDAALSEVLGREGATR
jgi:thiol-disulfide isomerase/thioredoxin